MPRSLVCGITCAAILAFCSCGTNSASRSKIPDDVNAALEKAESFELFSLDPDEIPADSADSSESGPSSAKKDEQRFQIWPALGSTTITDKAQREKLIAALQKGVAENDGMAAACFNPRHGIRVKHAGKVYDVVICFECMSASTYVDNVRRKGFLVTRTPQPEFDAVLKAANVPLPKAAK
jgi:hypothetical protein